jgi:aldose 1-epimerase
VYLSPYKRDPPYSLTYSTSSPPVPRTTAIDKYTMWTSTLLSLFAATAFAQYATPSNGTSGCAEGKYEISSEGIRACFIPYGASVSNLFIKGKDGVERDIVLGFDKVLDYEGEVHPHLGGVPGRYANRIKNSTFSIDGQQYHILPNENNNNDTLHGGPNGWDYRNFTVVSHTTDSITFSIVDPDGEQGFPGEVISYVTYTMTPNTWKIKIVAMATTKKTPIMLTSHVSQRVHIQNGRRADFTRLTGTWTVSPTRTRLLL